MDIKEEIEKIDQLAKSFEIENGEINCDSEEEDDNVNVIIKNPDFLLGNEIKKLVEISLKGLNDFITVCINSRIICISIHQPISLALQERLWKKSPSVTHSYKIFDTDVLENCMSEKKASNYDDRTIGFFAGHYGKLGEQSKEYHIYNEFSIIIVKNKKILDFATNGVAGDINYLIEKYLKDLSKIYFYSQEDSSLISFLNFVGQPFINYRHLFCRTKSFSNMKSIVFCPYRKVYCSLCRAIQTMIGSFKSHKPQTINIQNVQNCKPPTLKNFNSIQSTFSKTLSVTRHKPAYITGRIKTKKKCSKNYKIYDQMFKCKTNLNK